MTILMIIVIGLQAALALIMFLGLLSAEDNLRAILTVLHEIKNNGKITAS